VDAPQAGIQLAAEFRSQRNPFSTDCLGDELDLYLRLLRNQNNSIALDNRLAAQRPAFLKFGGGEADATPMADCTMLYFHQAATAAPLPTAWQV
jgi:hypothetical protein